MDLRKIPQSGVMSHRGLSGLFGHLRIGNSEVFVFSLPCLVSVTLDLRKIPLSGVMSYRGFIRIVWTFENWKIRGFGFFFALFGECDIGFKKNPTQWRYVT